VAVAVALLAPAAGAAPGSRGAEARGFGAYVDGATHAAASASTSGTASRDAGEAALVVPGAAIGRVALRTSATEQEEGATSHSVATARDVNLLDGRIVAASVEVGVHATSGPAGLEAGMDAFAAPGLLVDGRPVAVTPGARVELPGVGTLSMFEEVRDADGTVRANGLRRVV